MSFLAKILIFVLQTFSSLLSIYLFIVFGACILSFVNPDPYNPIVRFLRNLTDPAFYAIRKRLPFVVIGTLDLSPIVLIIFIQFISYVIIPELASLATAL